MKSQFILFIALFSLMLLSVSTVLAAPSLSMTWLTAPSDLYQGYNKTVSYNITNDGDSNLTVSLALDLSTLGLSSTASSISIPVNSSVVRTYAITTNTTSNVGAHTLTITALGINASSSNVTSSLSGSFNVIYPYCEFNSTTDPIEISDVTNSDDFDDENFKPLDSFNIKVKVENTDDSDSHKVIVSAVLVKDNEEVSDTDVTKKLTISEEKKEIITLAMNIPADLDAGIYYVYIKVYNDDDEDNCMQEVYQIEVKRSTYEVIFNNINPQANASCGSTMLVEGDIVNIGKNDEEKVKVSYSDSFGNIDSNEFDNLDSGDDIPVSFSAKIPRNASEASYSYTIKVSYDYDEDDHTYGETDSFPESFKVIGGCQPLFANQTIKTEASTAIIGTESEIRVMITNTGTIAQTFTVTATADWADINSVTPSVALNAGESKEFIIKAEAKASTAIGAHDMTVTVSHGSVSETQIIPVNVQKSSAKSGLIEQLKFQLKYNPTWVIIDSVLVIGIIAVLVLLLSGKKA